MYANIQCSHAVCFMVLLLLGCRDRKGIEPIGKSSTEAVGESTAQLPFQSSNESTAPSQKVVAFTDSVTGQTLGRLEKSTAVRAGSTFIIRGLIRQNEKPTPVTVKLTATSNGKQVIKASSTAELKPAGEGAFTYTATLEAPSSEGEYAVRVTTKGTSLIAAGEMQVRSTN